MWLKITNTPLWTSSNWICSCFVCIVFQYLCTAREGGTLDRPRGSVGTPRLAQHALEDTPPHTGACAGGEALHSWGSGWRSCHKTHSPPRSHDTPGLQDNPCERPNRDQQAHKRNAQLHWTYDECIFCIWTSWFCWNNISWTRLHNGLKLDALHSNSHLRPWHWWHIKS